MPVLTKAMEATRGTAHNQRERHGKDGASIIDGLTVGVAIAEGARAQLGSSDEDSKRQSHHDGLWLMPVDVVAGPQQQPDREARKQSIEAQKDCPELHGFKGAVILVRASVPIHRIP